jgi:hypothetical protein
MLRSNTPQEVCLLQTWGCWKQIRAFPLAVWFSKLVRNFKKLNSACCSRQNSNFGQWEYFYIRKDYFSVEQAEDASSDAMWTRFGTPESEGRDMWSFLPNLYLDNKHL